MTRLVKNEWSGASPSKVEDKQQYKNAKKKATRTKDKEDTLDSSNLIVWDNNELLHSSKNISFIVK